MLEPVARHAGFLLQQLAGLGHRRADHQARLGISERRHFRNRRTADCHRRELLFGQRTVQRLRNIGYEHRPQLELFQQNTQCFHIARRQHRTAQHVDLTPTGAGPGSCLFRVRNQRTDDFGNRRGITGFGTSGEIRCIHRYYGNILILRVFFAKLAHVAVHVGTLGFGQTCSQNRNQSRIAFFGDVLDTFDYVFVRAHYRTTLVHRRGLQRNRFTEMAYEKHFGECGTPLRAVQHRYSPVKPQCRERAADRLTGFQRADR